MKECMVSIVMSVYNGAEYLEQALKGIVDQTYQNWECIVVDDCSTDDTAAILAAFQKRDGRFRILTNKVNKKLAASLNRAVKEAVGEYIMRMDADDICRKDRVARHVGFMEKHPELSLSCCRFFALYQGKIIPTCLQRRGGWQEVEALFLFFNPILHPGVIGRRETFSAYAYNPAFSCTEDFDLWTRMLCGKEKIGIQMDYLMIYRIHPAQISIAKKDIQKEQSGRILQEYYRQRGIVLGREEIDFLMEGIYYRDRCNIQRCISLMKKVRTENKISGKMKDRYVCLAELEVIAAYRGEGRINLMEQVKASLSLPFPIVLTEAFGRKLRRWRSRRSYREAAEIFGLMKEEMGRKGADQVFYFPTEK